MTKKLEAELILRELAAIRHAIPFLQPNPPKPDPEGRAPLDDGMQSWTEEDFEYAAVEEGLASLAAELRASVDHAYALATQKALEIYYAAEELARDPANAELIPHVERMRESYERDYGTPIPAKAHG
jgi:hypothetical protein